MSNKKTKPIIEDLDVQAELEETSEEILEEVVNVALETLAPTFGTHIAADGDTYAALGKKFVKSGETPFQAANRISALNNGVVLKAGTVVNV